MVKNAYIFLAVLMLFMYAFTLWASSREGFENGESITLEGEDVFDEVYASIYNALWHSPEKLEFEKVSIEQLALDGKAVADVHIVDLCCGTAPNACYFAEKMLDYRGVDLSDAMLDKARKNCASAKFEKGDVTQTQLFPPKTFSIALLTNFSVYQFPNPKIVADNVYQWLKPGGTFVIHMVDPDKFDPKLDLATPFAAFSLQKYLIDRDPVSEIFFDQFKYSGKLVKKENEDEARQEEVLTYYDAKDNNGVKYREQRQQWTMPSKERLIDMIKTSGFRHIESVHMVSCGKEYQYLVYFSK